MTRTIAVLRTHLVDRFSLFLMPMSILAASFAINLAIWPFVPTDGRSTGGLATIYVVVLVTGMMMVGQSFAFVLSVGASRRTFAQGTGLTAVVLAISFGTLMTALGYIEQATNGWGMDGHFFALSWLADGNVLVRWAILTAPFLATFLLGSWVAAIFVRWNAAGLFCAALLTLLTAGAAAVLISWQHSWPSLGGWLADQTNLSTSGWVALLCLPLAASGYATLRRASV